MPAVSTAFQNSVLDGTFRSDLAEASYTVRLWFDNPSSVDPSEADFGGYTPATVGKVDWLPADGGEIESDGLIDLGTPSSDATDAIRFWSLHDAVTDELAYYAPVLSPMTVTEGGNAVRIRLTVPYGFNN